MGNLRFLKAFVAQPSTLFVTGVGLKPPDLTLGQILFYQVDQQGITVGGTGATPAPATIRRTRFAQQVGDSAFGTVKSQPIWLDSVVSWFGKAATVPAVQISYIGWDEVDGTKDIAAKCGDILTIPIRIYDKKLARWYGANNFQKNIIVDTSCCPDCGSPCTAADKLAIATNIALQINTGIQKAGDFAAGNELNQYLTAVVVTNGLTDAALRVGVKITAIAPNYETLTTCNPFYWWEFVVNYFTIGETYNGICTGTLLPVTTTQEANPGSGWSAAVAALEAESQGFDRVRDPLSEYPYFLNNGYKIFSLAGVKYDYYHLNFNFEHSAGGLSTGVFIKEPYEIVICVPTGTGATVQAAINAWLVNRFPAVTL